MPLSTETQILTFFFLRHLLLFFFFFFIILIIFNKHGKMGGGFLKKTYNGVYPKWPNSWMLFFLLRILSIFNTHRERREKVFFKENYNDVYSKLSNSWIYNTGFKPLLFTLVFQCEINQLFFLLRILSIFNTHIREEGRKLF